MYFRIFVVIHGGGTKGFSSSSFKSRDPLWREAERGTSGVG